MGDPIKPFKSSNNTPTSDNTSVVTPLSSNPYNENKAKVIAETYERDGQLGVDILLMNEAKERSVESMFIQKEDNSVPHNTQWMYPHLSGSAKKQATESTNETIAMEIVGGIAGHTIGAGVNAVRATSAGRAVTNVIGKAAETTINPVLNNSSKAIFKGLDKTYELAGKMAGEQVVKKEGVKATVKNVSSKTITATANKSIHAPSKPVNFPSVKSMDLDSEIDIFEKMQSVERRKDIAQRSTKAYSAYVKKSLDERNMKRIDALSGLAQEHEVKYSTIINDWRKGGFINDREGIKAHSFKKPKLEGMSIMKHPSSRSQYEFLRDLGVADGPATDLEIRTYAKEISDAYKTELTINPNRANVYNHYKKVRPQIVVSENVTDLYETVSHEGRHAREFNGIMLPDKYVEKVKSVYKNPSQMRTKSELNNLEYYSDGSEFGSFMGVNAREELVESGIMKSVYDDLTEDMYLKAIKENSSKTLTRQHNYLDENKTKDFLELLNKYTPYSAVLPATGAGLTLNNNEDE